jgi:uncharacterized protein (DUF3084 family)
MKLEPQHFRILERLGACAVMLILFGVLSAEHRTRSRLESEIALRGRELELAQAHRSTAQRQAATLAAQVSKKDKDIASMAADLNGYELAIEGLEERLAASFHNRDELQQSFDRYRFANAIVEADVVDTTRGIYRGVCSLVIKSETNRTTLHVKDPPMTRRSASDPWELDRATVGRKTGLPLGSWAVEGWNAADK